MSRCRPVDEKFCSFCWFVACRAVGVADIDVYALRVIHGAPPSCLMVDFVDPGESKGVNGDERKVVKLVRMIHSVYAVVADDLAGCQEATRREVESVLVCSGGVLCSAVDALVDDFIQGF